MKDGLWVFGAPQQFWETASGSSQREEPQPEYMNSCAIIAYTLHQNAPDWSRASQYPH